MDSGPHPPAAGAHGEDVPDWDVPIPYVRRTHEWYGALGYGNPYRYAHFVEVPFAPLRRPLARSRVALLTTAAPYRPDRGPQDARAPYNAAAKFYEPYSGDTGHDHDLRVSHVAVDRDHLGDDADCWFPLPALRRAAAAGRVGEVAPRFHGVPTNRSQRHTLEVDGPELLARVRADGADVAVLVPNCPVCHQSVSLAARMLEENGIATVVMGCAKDIVEHVGVPRLLFSDFPLGNAAGRPRDPQSQALTLDLALSVLETATGPRTTVRSPLKWSDSPDWKLDYCNIERLSAQEIAVRRAEFDKAKDVAKAVRERTPPSYAD
jgi:D-proline reductase (dithiol) PrdB